MEALDRYSPAMKSQLASMERQESLNKELLETNRNFIKEEESEVAPSVKGEGKAGEILVPGTALSSMVHSKPMIGGPLESSSEDKERDSAKEGSIERKIQHDFLNSC